MTGNEVAEVQRQVDQQSQLVDGLLTEVGKVIVGQRYMLERILIGLLCGGHCLIEGVPGLAKTLAVKTLSEVLDASFSRIQFTPDILPADITGTTIYNMHSGTFTVKRGPIFANLVLADEINRAPAKVQSALLEAMQERQVTIGEQSSPLPAPFMVLATQNPIEQEGTYALPEAQLDRFMLRVRVGYPSRSEERRIMDRMIDRGTQAVQKVYSVAHLQAASAVLHGVYIDDSIRDYIVAIVQATREPRAHGVQALEPLMAHGASPRASIFLAKAAQAHAFLRRRGHVLPEDVKAIGPDVLGHRIALSYEAQAQDIGTDVVIARLFEGIAVP